MKIKTNELTGAALDWAVGTSNGGLYQPDSARDAFWIWPREPVKYSKAPPAYSTDWAQGGPIIEREHIALDYYHTPIHPDVQPRWEARHGSGVFEYGPTPLIAAMRSYVASKLGDEVEIPEELT